MYREKERAIQRGSERHIESIYIYRVTDMYRETDIHTERKRVTYTERQMDIQSDRHKERKRRTYRDSERHTETQMEI